MMPVFHRHFWCEVGRRFTPSRLATVDRLRTSTESFERLMYGFTSVELKCSICAEIRFIETTGDQTRTLNMRSE